MSSHTVAALLCGLLLGFWLASECAEVRLRECAEAGAVVVNHVAYTVTPMQKGGE